MQTTARHAQVHAIEMLKTDHDKVKELFGKFFESGDHAYKTRQRIAEQIYHELSVHSQLEEQIFYPALRAAADKEGTELVLEGEEEHHVVDILMEELKAMSPEDETFQAKMKVLCENVEHHIEEEETEMFPHAQRFLGDRMEALGMEMMSLKKELTRSA